MDPTKVEWTTTEFSLQGYVTTFHNAFPNIIRITEGFLGKQEIDSISSSTVIRVHSHCTQQRIAAETKSGKFFSLPTNLTRLKFIVGQDSGPTKTLRLPMTLEDILSRYTLPLTVRSSSALSYKQKGDKKSQDELLSELTLQDRYEENFLFGHPIDKEIYMLDKKDISPQDHSYSTIEPIYIDISELNESKKTPLENEVKCNVYQIRPVPLPKPDYRNLCLEATKTVIPSENTFSSISDIPKDLRNLTVSQVCQCLKLLNMNQYEEAFKSAQVDGQLVYDLNHEMMTSCLGMNGLNVVKFMKFRDGWRPNVQY
ncbi:uncharacterized protein [Phyllobates terribilis]|uniref:uncharacterized protein isoform X2 n=1 Tax=Phyllobates terribilis TaxID=111132 RepID=UPI003CCA86BB